MRCPVCRCECRVKAVESETKTVLYFYCRSRQCPEYDPEFRHPVAEKEMPKS